MTPDEETKPADSTSSDDAIGKWVSCAEKCAHREPLKCTAIAFLAGIVLTVLPIGAILGAIVRLFLALLRPALVVLGAMKVLEEVEKRRQS